MAQVQALLRPCDRHVEQPQLLVETARRSTFGLQRPAMGEQAFLDANHEDHAPLAAFGSVDRGQQNCGRPLVADGEIDRRMETNAALCSVRQPSGSELRRERRGLVIRAKEDRDVSELPDDSRVKKTADLGCDERRLGPLVGERPEGNGRAIGVCGPERRPEGEPHAKDVGDVNDLTSGTIVLGQIDPLSVREVLRKVEQEAHIGTTPAEHRLAGVTNHGQIAMPRGELP